ncbi:MAG: S9 family peptidase [Phycisphaerae bacterium]|nr:S9 family peptidase [Phycisphaerae bacterium]
MPKPKQSNRPFEAALKKGSSDLRSKGHDKKRHRRPIVAGDLLCMTGVADPQVTPAGDEVVFVRKVIGDRNRSESSLWRVATDGKSPPRPLTTGLRDTQPRIGPDGHTIAFVRGADDKPSQIAIIDRLGGEGRAITRFGEGTIKLLSWSPDGSMLAVSFRPCEPDRTRAATRARELSGASEPPRVLEHRWCKLDGDGWFGETRFAIHLVDARNGRDRMVYGDDQMGVMDVAWSPDSARLAITTNRAPDALFKPWKSEIVLYDLASERIISVPGLPIGPKGSVAWSPDGSRLAWAGRTGRDGIYSTENLELWTCAAPVAASSSGRKRRSVALPARGEPRSLTHGHDLCLAAATLSDCADSTFEASIRWSDDSSSVLARIGRHGSGHLIAVDLDGSAPRFLTEAGGEFSLGNLSGDGTLLAATRTDPVTLPEVGVLRIGRKSAAWQPLTSFNARLLDELELSKPTEHWITAEDGARVHLWVMEPPAGAPTTKGGRRPAVLEIHGGPHAQYGNVFFHEFQLLAAQGYVVVYSNPRGSKGYGRDHCAAIRGNWGDRDWVDIQAVTRFMEGLRGVDPKRMGIMGGSYGGYMTNWAIAHTKVFRAAITDRCVSNLLSMGGNSDFVQVPDEYWPGANFDRPERLWDRSPIAHFKGVSTPTLIIHSEGDLRCNIEQSEEIHSALALQGVPCRFVRYPVTTSHGMSRNGPADLRVHRLDEIVAWWKRWL